jgi:signal transduction histidine kinase
MIGVIVYAYSRYRLRRLEERSRELENTVEERTHEISLKAEQIRSQAELLSDQNKELEEKNEEIIKTQEQLIMQEKLASLGALTAGIAHEIKNPLNFVNNFAELSIELMQELQEDLAAQKDRLDEKTFSRIEDTLTDLEHNSKKINEHGKRADSIVRGMLLHSRGKSGERMPIDINTLLDEYVNLAYHGLRAQDSSFNIAIKTDYDPSVGMLDVVPQDLSRVFLNIVNNACYAANEKKQKVDGSFAPALAVSTKNLGDKVEVRIRDNGSGIPKEIIDKVFDPFFTTKPTGKGTGLGLSLSYDIVVKEHGGDLKVETEPGSFTEFIIVLPRTNKARG